VTITNSAYSSLPSLPLMIWLSPAFPVGSFAYSHALEWAAEAGDLPSAEALQSWLADLIAHGAMRNDAILLCGHGAPRAMPIPRHCNGQRPCLHRQPRAPLETATHFASPYEPPAHEALTG
jgi:hypothetical protein